jgi:signal transduction histidine kinase
VAVRRAERDVVVGVGDHGAGGAPNGSGAGAGLPGMRERAAALGGTLDAGPEEGGGWRVRATLPADVGARA